MVVSSEEIPWNKESFSIAKAALSSAAHVSIVTCSHLDG